MPLTSRRDVGGVSIFAGRNLGCAPRVARKGSRARPEGTVRVQSPVMLLPSSERVAWMAESYQSTRIATRRPSTSRALTGTRSWPLTTAPPRREMRRMNGSSPPGEVSTARHVPSSFGRPASGDPKANANDRQQAITLLRWPLDLAGVDDLCRIDGVAVDLLFDHLPLLVDEERRAA